MLERYLLNTSVLPVRTCKRSDYTYIFTGIIVFWSSFVLFTLRIGVCFNEKQSTHVHFGPHIWYICHRMDISYLIWHFVL
jgi:hypothetical protein